MFAVLWKTARQPLRAVDDGCLLGSILQMLDRCVVLAHDGSLGAWTGFTWKKRRAIAGWNVVKISHDSVGFSLCSPLETELTVHLSVALCF